MSRSIKWQGNFPEPNHGKTAIISKGLPHKLLLFLPNQDDNTQIQQILLLLAFTGNTLELLKMNLAIEPDLQNFIQFVLAATSGLGGDPFPATLATLALIPAWREAGAASGYPLPVCLELTDNRLEVAWGEDGHRQTVSAFKHQPAIEIADSLRLQFQQSTASIDPELLLKRNREMEAFLNETKARAEKEMAEVQRALEVQQNELADSIHQAHTDALTGLLNRRAYDEKLAHAFGRAMRQKTEPLSLILFDLDFFKEINDTHGHQYGDEYLKKMANAISANIRREVDYAFRFGGDEFAAIIHADKHIASEKAGHILTAMGNKVSIGIASLSKHEPFVGNLEAFIHQADDALYHAKNAGRGQIASIHAGKRGEMVWDEIGPEKVAA